MYTYNYILSVNLLHNNSEFRTLTCNFAPLLLRLSLAIDCSQKKYSNRFGTKNHKNIHTPTDTCAAMKANKTVWIGLSFTQLHENNYSIRNTENAFPSGNAALCKQSKT